MKNGLDMIFPRREVPEARKRVSQDVFADGHAAAGFERFDIQTEKGTIIKPGCRRLSASWRVEIVGAEERHDQARLDVGPVGKQKIQTPGLRPALKSRADSDVEASSALFLTA
jgi:hypothetical protein